MLAARLGSATPLLGDPQTLNAVAAVFLGMTAFREGRPHILGTLTGVLLLNVLLNGLAIMGVNANYQQLMTGGVIIGAVALAGLSKKQRA
jgi:ribose transport system permease protein